MSHYDPIADAEETAEVTKNVRRMVSDTPLTDAVCNGERWELLLHARRLEKALKVAEEALTGDVATRLCGLHGLRLEGEPKPIDNTRQLAAMREAVATIAKLKVAA